MSAKMPLPDLNQPQPGKRLSGAVLPVLLGLIALLVLSSAPASWAAVTATVPRETPTRRATATLPPGATPVPTFSPTTGVIPPATATPLPATATAAAALATATPVIPGAASPTGATAPTQPATPVTIRVTVTPGPAISTPATAAPSPTAAAGATAAPAAPSPAAASACHNTGQVLRWSDGRAVLNVPTASITMPVCIYLDYVNLAALPSAPAGFSLGVSARVRVTDAAGGALPAFAFAQPASLSLRVDGVSGAAPDVTTADIGFLGETSSDWVIVEAERDQTASLLTAHPRRAGVYALLVRLPAPAESQPVSSSAGTRLLLPLAGLAFVLLALALLVILGRRR